MAKKSKKTSKGLKKKTTRKKLSSKSKKSSKKKKVKKKSTKKKKTSKKTIKKKHIKKSKKSTKKKVAKKKPTKKRTKKKEEEKLKPPIYHLKISEQKVKDFIADLIGQDTIPVVDLLLKKNNVSEFIIAEKLNMSINQFRKIIYKLDNYSLVNSVRKKDKQRGWYIYYWTLDPKKVEDLYWDTKRKRLEKLKNKIKEEQTNYFYICANKCERVDLQEAMELEFRCPECGKLLEQDKSKEINKIKKEIEFLENELKEREQPS